MPSPFPLAVAVGHQAPQSMGFPRQEHWSGLLFPSPGDLPDPGTELASPALAGRFLTTVPPGKPHTYVYVSVYIYVCILQRQCILLKNRRVQKAV